MSSTNPLRLNLDGRTADIQVVQNYVTHGGRVQPPIEGDDQMSWASAPKLNGIYLFSYLTKKSFKVGLINSYYNETDHFKQLLDRNPRVIVISTTFIAGKQNLIKLVADIRDLAPDVFIVVGGPLVYMSYLMLERISEPDYDTGSATDEFLFLDGDNEPDVDLCVISLRGEQLLCDILDRLRGKEGIDDIPNCARRIGREYQFTKRADDISGSEDFAIDWAALPDTIFQSGVVPMQASNGCPYHCAFCNFTRGARYVWFVDDNFRLGQGDLEAVCRRFIDERLAVKWMTFVRASTLDHVDTDLLRQAGCIEVQLGLESADPVVLKRMNKKASPGLFIKAYDGQDYEGNLCWSMFPFTLIPLSPVYETGTRQQYGITGYLHKWQHATMNSDQAREQLFKTFLEMEDSGPIYRGDNQEILRRLGSSGRKKFEAMRHKLSKRMLSGDLGKDTILQSFRQVLPRILE